MNDVLLAGALEKPVSRDQQNSVRQGESPGPSALQLRGRLAAYQGHRLAEAARAKPGERGYPKRLRRRDHTSHGKIIKSAAGSSYETVREALAYLAAAV